MATAPTYKTKAEAYFSTVGATKTLTIPATTVAGDLMLMQWVGGSALDSEPAGWSKVEEVNDGHQHIVWSRIAQAGDASTAVVVPATTTAKSFLRILVYSGASTTQPVAGSASLPEPLSSTTHASPTVAGMPADGRVVQFHSAKDAVTSSSARSVGAGYVDRGNLDSGAATYAFVSMAADRTAATTAGTVASVTWTSDQATATATTITVVLAAASTTVGARLAADLAIPAGATIVGGASAFAVLSDNDPNTYVRIPLSGTPLILDERAVVLSAPFNTFSWDFIHESGTATFNAVAAIYNGATLIRSYPAFTTVSTGGVTTYTATVTGPDQASQTTLGDIRLRLTVTGS